jgi:hypothetical protein
MRFMWLFNDLGVQSCATEYKDFEDFRVYCIHRNS